MTETDTKALATARKLLQAGLDLNQRADLDLLDRFERYGPDLVAGLSEVYDVAGAVANLIPVLLRSHENRSESLRQRDRERVLRPDWFQSESTVGYVCYADLFAKNLSGVTERIDYLKGLGVSYLHLMPVLKPRPGANDGGYAVMDYRALRDDLGTMQDLSDLATKLHDAGISLTLDLVLNHVAKEHEWAIRAQAGEAAYRDYFYVFETRDLPDQYEKELPEVFPDFAPGNFSFDEKLDSWVWTTFNDYQWDVNWSNPAIFCEFADIIGNLANHGVDCLRLDAIAFIWKRLGTNCQNQPEVHSITQALRAFTRILAPAVIFKAEAIVGPAQVGAYLGEASRAGKVSDMAYHNSLMVQIWSAMAAKETKLLELALARFRALPTNTAWGLYLRCHDDIGWAIDDSDAQLAGLNGHDHRMFLADFYTGKYYGSTALGVDFQLDPQSGERRTSGTAASLAGIEHAVETADLTALGKAIDRYLCGYGMVFGFGGVPLLYMGDEIGLFNDLSYQRDAAKADDSRWIHRPAMNWDIALRAALPKTDGSVAQLVRRRMQNLIETRRRLPSLHASVASKVRAARGAGVAIIERHHPFGDLIQIYNLTDASRWVGTEELGGLSGLVRDELTEREFDLGGGISLNGYQMLWLTKA
ncbi:MAG: hypothetical protein RL670_268 [Actinomycetota bacterium]|jgi:amylosucrase